MVFFLIKGCLETTAGLDLNMPAVVLRFSVPNRVFVDRWTNGYQQKKKGIMRLGEKDTKKKKNRT